MGSKIKQPDQTPEQKAQKRKVQEIMREKTKKQKQIPAYLDMLKENKRISDEQKKK